MSKTSKAEIKDQRVPDIVIEDLDEKAKSFRQRNIPWSLEEKGIVVKYYKKVPLKDLMKHLPGRTGESIRLQYQRLVNEQE